MNRFAQLWRTTTVRLTALFIVLFVLFAIGLLTAIALLSSGQIQNQQRADIDREVELLTRVDAVRGIRPLIVAVNWLSAQAGPGVYYLSDNVGQQIAGNLPVVPPDVLRSEGMFTFPYPLPLSQFDVEGETNLGRPDGFALVRSVVLDSGMRLIVGRDVVERRGFTAIILQAFVWGVIGIVIASTIAGAVTARRVLRRIDAINSTSAKIMSGNLSERVPVTRRNDEFDVLATSLNAMLDRIEGLMQGLKEVTDNVAHDLKTPLTRLRNKAESALRGETSPEEQRAALETTISESDKLIRTFNALLMIARAEAGAPSGAFADTDISTVATDVAELYAPAAEEQGLTLGTAIAPGVRLRANRELIGQALVNLIENALKYHDAEEGKAGRVTIGVRAENGRVLIEVGDNGPGIPSEDRGRVVERFVRLEKSRTEPGSGLGLSLVAAVARLHRGEFRIEDNSPGVRAIIDLPATPA